MWIIRAASAILRRSFRKIHKTFDSCLRFFVYIYICVCVCVYKCAYIYVCVCVCVFVLTASVSLVQMLLKMICPSVSMFTMGRWLHNLKGSKMYRRTHFLWNWHNHESRVTVLLSGNLVNIQGLVSVPVEFYLYIWRMYQNSYSWTN